MWLRELKQGICNRLKGWMEREVQEGGDMGVPYLLLILVDE